MTDKPFSRQLEEWLASDRSKTLQGLIDRFAEKSFAVLFVVLMAVPALPLPTGGVTHVFEIITMLLSLELIIGVKLWLPKPWKNMQLPRKLRVSTLPFLIKAIRKAEGLSWPALGSVFKRRLVIRITGLLVLGLTLFAFLAPPFSGLDTLPSLGVVLIALAMLTDSFILFFLGLVAGLVGAGLIIATGEILVNLILGFVL